MKIIEGEQDGVKYLEWQCDGMSNRFFTENNKETRKILKRNAAHALIRKYIPEQYRKFVEC